MWQFHGTLQKKERQRWAYIVCYGRSLLQYNHHDMLFVCRFYWPSFLGTVITSYPNKISTCEYKLQVISQPVLFIAFLFSLSLVWSVKSLDCIIFCHFAAHMKINLTCKYYKIEPSAVINMIGKLTINICSKCKYKDTIYLAQSTLVNVFHRDPIA